MEDVPNTLALGSILVSFTIASALLFVKLSDLLQARARALKKAQKKERKRLKRLALEHPDTTPQT